jgi:hypothetical protein
MTTFLGDSNADLHMDTRRSTTLNNTGETAVTLQIISHALPLFFPLMVTHVNQEAPGLLAKL